MNDTDDRPTLAFIVSRTNEGVTRNLLAGAQEELTAQGIDGNVADVVWVPGSAELPLAAQTAAQTGRYDAVVCLGAIIRGETQHHTHLAQSVLWALQFVALEQEVPVTIGVITADSLTQALDRSGGKHGNAGRRATAAAVEMIEVLSRLETLGGAEWPVEALDLPDRTRAALERAGLTTVGRLSQESAAAVRRIPGIGSAAAQTISDHLAEFGFSLAPAESED